MATEYDPTRTWSCKSLWTGKGDDRKPNPQAVEALNYLHEWKIIRGVYKGNAHASATTLPNALRRHLPNVPGLSGPGTRDRVREFTRAASAMRKASAPKPRKAKATDAPVVVNLSAEAFAAFEAWREAQDA